MSERMILIRLYTVAVFLIGFGFGLTVGLAW